MASWPKKGIDTGWWQAGRVGREGFGGIRPTRHPEDGQLATNRAHREGLKSLKVPPKMASVVSRVLRQTTDAKTGRHL